MSGGFLTSDAYRSLAERHRPADQRVAIRELASHGLRAADIARLLCLSEPAVAALLQRVRIAPGEVPA